MGNFGKWLKKTKPEAVKELYREDASAFASTKPMAKVAKPALARPVTDNADEENDPVDEDGVKLSSTLEKRLNMLIAEMSRLKLGRAKQAAILQRVLETLQVGGMKKGFAQSTVRNTVT